MADAPMPEVDRIALGYVPEPRFWAKVDMSGECWLWTAGVHGKGYGAFTIGRARKQAHRWLFEQVHGVQPKGSEICHECDNPRCVRPSHLFAGSKSDNMKDCAAKGRNIMQTNPEKSFFCGRTDIQVRGEAHYAAKLTSNEIIAMRQLFDAGHSTTEISERFGLTRGHARRIVLRQAWKHVGESNV